MFRTFIELNIPTGQSLFAQFVATQDFILTRQGLNVDDGFVRFSAILGGTPSGTFTAGPVIGMNRMSNRPTPVYTPTSTFGSGGSVAGGSEVEVVRLKTTNASAQTQSVGDTNDSSRGLPSGTYHLKFQNLGNSTLTGVFVLEWEEWVERSNKIHGGVGPAND